MLNITKIQTTAMVGLFLLFSGTVNAAELKIGVVDIPKAIQATKEGKEIKGKLEKEYQKRKDDMDKRAKDITKMQQDFEKKSLVLSDEARAKKQQEIQEETVKFSELREKNLQELAKKDREFSQPMLKKLNTVIGDIAKKDGYTAIFHKNDQNLVWAAKEIDITDAVIKGLENAK
jgi:outer membrane protein